MTPPGPWPSELTRRAGRQVRKYRDREGISAEELAKAVTTFGLPYTRSQVTNLEANRRNAITVGEVIALAHVLRVPPLQLIFPLDDDERSTEIIPGTDVEVWDAARWFTGDAGFPGEDPMTWTLVREFREHDQALIELRKERLTLRHQQEAEAPLYKQLTAVVGLRPDDLDPSEIEDPNVFRSWRVWRKLTDEIEWRQTQVKKLEFDVVMRRRRLRERGIEPPSLDDELGNLDVGETEGES